VTQPVTHGAVSRSVTATGTVNPVLTIIVGSYVSGVVQEIDCDFNTRVKRGQVCAKIDPRPYQTIVDQERAALANAGAQRAKDAANLAFSARQERRFHALSAQNAISQDTYDATLNSLQQAKAQAALDDASIQQHMAALKAASINLGYTDIVSPVDGVVVSRNVTIGQTVAASFQTPTLFLIATDLANMQVDTNVSESDIGAIRVGDRAIFTVEAYDRTFAGTVTQLRQAPQTVQNVVTYDLVVTVDNRALLLKPGMTATVKIVTAERDGVLRVPNQALRYVPGGLKSNANGGAGKGVWLLRNGKPVFETVTTGLDDDNFTEVLAGRLTAGEPVIVSESSASSSRNSGNPAARLP